jgi:hypothetical protein
MSLLSTRLLHLLFSHYDEPHDRGVNCLRRRRCGAPWWSQAAYNRRSMQSLGIGTPMPLPSLRLLVAGDAGVHRGSPAGRASGPRPKHDEQRAHTGRLIRARRGAASRASPGRLSEDLS